MSITKSKYKNITDQHYPINGNMVHYHTYKNKLSKAKLAKDLDILPATLTQYFKQNSLQFGIIWRLSKALNHNFLAQMSEFLEIPFETQEIKKLKSQLAEMEEKNKRLEMALEIYKEMRK